MNNTLILRETPNAFSNITGPNVRLFNGNDGFLYDYSDVVIFTRTLGEPTARKTKYGTSYYWKNVPSNYRQLY